MSGQDLVRTTPFPNSLFPAMSRLRDTEWRVLCVIIRFTVGFVDPITKHRKLTAPISHGQFKRWTGRESAAISSAIGVLADAGLIYITDLAGYPVSSRSQRRRARHRLVFGIAPRLLVQS